MVTTASLRKGEVHELREFFTRAGQWAYQNRKNNPQEIVTSMVVTLQEYVEAPSITHARLKVCDIILKMAHYDCLRQATLPEKIVVMQQELDTMSYQQWFMFSMGGWGLVWTEPYTGSKALFYAVGAYEELGGQDLIKDLSDRLELAQSDPQILAFNGGSGC